MKIVQSETKPTPEALEQEPGVWLVYDDTKEMEIGAINLSAEAAKTAIPTRTDLDPDHWLYGYKVIKHGYAGSCDHIVGEDGAIYPVPNQQELDKLISSGIIKKQ